MSNETEMKDNVREDVYDKELFDRLLDQNDIDEFRKEFLELHSNRYLINISNNYTAMLKEYKNVFNYYSDNINNYEK